MRIKAFIFDVDGTLLDSIQAHVSTWLQAFKAHGYELGRDEVLRVVGMGSDKMIPLLTGLVPDDPAVKAIQEHKTALYETHYLPHIQPLPGVERLFRELHSLGMRVAVASSTTGEKLERLLCIAGCDRHLPAESCVEGRSKPDPDKVIGAVQWLKLAPEECVMVGDSPADAQAAARAGVHFIGLLSGGRSSADLQPALATFGGPAEMAEKISSLVRDEATA